MTSRVFDDRDLSLLERPANNEADAESHQMRDPRRLASSVVVVGVAALATTACPRAESPGGRPNLGAAAESITVEGTREVLKRIAHDSTRGRNTPGTALEQVAGWLATELQSADVTPAGDSGGFIQRYPVHLIGRGHPGIAGVKFTPGRELSSATQALPYGWLGPDRRQGRGRVTVLVRSPSVRPPEVRSLADRIVLAVPEVASGVRPGDLIGVALVGSAAGMIIAVDRGDAYWTSATLATRSPRVVQVGPRGLLGHMPVVLAQTEALDEALPDGFSMATLAERARKGTGLIFLDDLWADVSQQPPEVQDETAPNVIGLLMGSDPEVAHEHVVLSAHFDHVGVGPPDERGDSVYNGANDNASGTAAVLLAAKALAAMPTRPRRSISVAFFSGEEVGLLGSRYFVASLADPTSYVAAVNVDMVGQGQSGVIYVWGVGYSDVGQLTIDASTKTGDIVARPFEGSALKEDLFLRSDQLSFVEGGIPSVLVADEGGRHYHQPSDEVPTLDVEKVAKVARLLVRVAYRLADSPKSIAWKEVPF